MQEQSYKKPWPVLWITGFIWSGKTTLGEGLERYFIKRWRVVQVLDGDAMRKFFPKPLGFSREDRRLNIAIAAMTARLLSDHGIIAIVTLVSPHREDREKARKLVENFVEIHVNTPLEVCESRDKRNLYHTARVKGIPNFTGITSPYEPPMDPDIKIPMDQLDPEEAVEKVIRYLQQKGFIPS